MTGFIVTTKACSIHSHDLFYILHLNIMKIKIVKKTDRSIQGMNSKFYPNKRKQRNIPDHTKSLHY